MRARPTYIGVGECKCGRIDVQLYQLSGAPVTSMLSCALCLADRGLMVPRARTAEDIEIVDGKPRWMEALEHSLEPVGLLDLGQGHALEAVLGSDDLLMGWLHTHPSATRPGVSCQSFCAVRPIDKAPVHQVTCSDPLTLSPSLKCRSCGAHGMVEGGVWKPLPQENAR